MVKTAHFFYYKKGCKYELGKSLEILKEGNERYLDNQLKPRDYRTLREGTVDGQYPLATVLACSDSRVIPEIIFDQSIGDIFTIRNAGNIISSNVLGSIEYSISQLNVPLVLGHTGCGAIKATYNYEALELSSNLEKIVLKILEEKESSYKNKDELMFENVNNMINLIEKNKLVQMYSTKLIGAVYNLESGRVDFLE